MLKVSTKGRYAVRIMVYLALAKSDRPSRKQDIADSEEISADYVEQILIRLRAGGLVISHRGARGGFTLSREPHQITVLEVLEATEGPMELAPCIEAGCRRESVCVTRRFWGETEALLVELFKGKSIADMADEVRQMRGGVQMMYDI